MSIHSPTKENAPAPASSVIAMFEATAQRYSQIVAIEWGDSKVTYGELREQVGRLSALLTHTSHPRGTLVAVVLHDSIQIVRALLSIIRSGYVFVPLDPAMPEERLRLIARNLAPTIVLAETSTYDQSRRIFAEAAVLDINYAAEERRALLHDGPESKVSPQPEAKPCYIYYTSGSTGQPKGIVGSLKGLSHFIQWEIDTLGSKAGDRYSQFVSPTFDAYLRDTLVALCSGGTICIPPQPVRMLSSNELAAWINHQSINVVHCVPSVFVALLDASLTNDMFPHLRYILMAGEALQVRHVGAWMAIFANRVQLINLFGATETTMVKLFHFVQPQDLEREFIPVGKPMRGTRAILLDEQNNVCPKGVVGEMYIRSPYMTLGYYQNPEATNEVFVQNPFSNDPADIIYKTGDLARLLDDGSYQFIGRRDHQIKLRGIRIELEEIERAIQAYPAVKQAAVIAREDIPGDMRLAAYLVLHTPDEDLDGALRAFLSTSLPDYMIPTHFMVLNALPLNSSGKVNRRALPAPDGGSYNRSIVPYVAPQTPTEVMVAKIWAEVLQVEQVGLNDNFFRQGGHSLLAIQAVSRIHAELGVDLPLRQLFDAPTIGEIASLIDQHQAQPAANPVVIPSREEQRLLEMISRLEQLSNSEAATLLGEQQAANEGLPAYKSGPSFP